MARLFWQDDESASVRCGDLRRSTDGWTLASLAIEGTPAIDDADQSLVQMRHHDGLVVVGVRDSDDGKVGSGWFAIESGVIEEPHGDHSHWYFKREPRVIQASINESQGNPAHVYLVDEHFVLANDKLNGFTLTTPRRIRDSKVPDDAATFYHGGNGHITIAVAPEKVAYATWIAPAGDDCGRVDVIGLGANTGRSYSFRCPTGMLHGAILHEDKAFFAPAEGICWVGVDPEVDDIPSDVHVHHISLGHDADDKPLRTGAFAKAGSHVVFTAGKDAATKLCWIDASSAQPVVESLPIELQDGETISTPVTIRTRYGDALALLFGQFKETPENDRLLIVNLDPNDDGRFNDAELRHTLAVGPNQLVGHSGYHAVAMLPDRRHVAVSNPGDGTLWIIGLRDLEVEAKLDVDGTPTRLVTIP